MCSSKKTILVQNHLRERYMQTLAALIMMYEFTYVLNNCMYMYIPYVSCYKCI